MSIYSQPQTQAYGQLSYPAQGYGQPVLPPAAYHYPPAQPIYHVDPNTFRRDYMARLAELTVNSRPIIQNLSMIAQEYSRYAEIVAQCLESHIRRVPQWMKLPAFYLLDAISKNVYDPYARHFTPMVVRLYLDTYDQVDQNTRSKMEEMLLTWRTGAPNGRELFGVVPQVAIERHIWGGDSNHNATSSSRPGVQPISTAQVLSELEFVLNQKERAMQMNPYDKTSQSHISVLHQLRKLVQSGVSQHELGQILTQLRALAQPTQPAVPLIIPPPTTQSYVHPSPPPIPSHCPQSISVPQISYPPTSSYSVPPVVPKVEPSDVPSVPVAQALSPPTAVPSSVPVNNFANLYSALLKAGVVSARGTPTGTDATAKAEESSRSLQQSDIASDGYKDYRKAVLGLRVNLTGADIMKQRARIAEFLYDRLPGQCKQCGLRFSESTRDKKTMEMHLDMHFTQNRKAGQAIGRGHSRSWFVTVEDWTHDGAVDPKGKGRVVDRSSNISAAAAAEAAQREAELRTQFVVVPPGDEAKTISCPICKEPLKSEFSEDDEEWVWRNAVSRDDKIFHATCHAEAAASKTTLATRLRNEVSGSRSRSRTPDSVRTPPKVTMPLTGERPKSESPSPPTPARSKRKAEDVDDDRSPVPESQEDVPPSKKLALSA